MKKAFGILHRWDKNIYNEYIRQLMHTVDGTVRECACVSPKGGTCFMEELIRFCQRYQGLLKEAALVLMGLLILLLLARILRQIKRLNRSFGDIIGNVQAYFDVILRDEEEEEAKQQLVQIHKMEETEESVRDKQELTAEQEKKKAEDEKLFNAVLQEYFS